VYVPLKPPSIYQANSLPAIPNLHSIQTLTSEKAASALDKHLPSERTTPLNVLLQVNTSGEESKSGLNPLTSTSSDSPLLALALHVVRACPRLRLQGLMTIGALEASLTADAAPNRDFETLVATRDALAQALNAARESGVLADGQWGENGRLLLSMGMSADYEAALRAGADIVRVGTGVFGARKSKEELKAVEAKVEVDRFNQSSGDLKPSP
jgi:PLP dependent protein